MRFATQALSAVAVVGVVAGGSTAFTDSNTNGSGGNFVNTALGQGSTVTSGYTVSSVVYNLGTASNDADRVKSVVFTLTGTVAPATVKVRLATTDTYNTGITSCVLGTPSGSYVVSVTCTASGTGYLITGVNTLDILATSF